MSRLETLQSIFERVDEDKKTVIEPLLYEVVYLEDRLKELKTFPHIRIHPKNPSRQEITPAGKQYKETMQTYINALKVLQTTLGRYTQEDEDEFEKWINENRQG